MEGEGEEEEGRGESSSKASVRSSAWTWAKDFFRECEWCGEMGALGVRLGREEIREGGFGVLLPSAAGLVGVAGRVGCPSPSSDLVLRCEGRATLLVDLCEFGGPTFQG